MQCKLGSASTFNALLTCLKLKDKNQRIGVEVTEQGVKLCAASDGRDVQIFGWIQAGFMRAFTFDICRFIELPFLAVSGCMQMFGPNACVELSVTDTSLRVTLEENMDVMRFELRAFHSALYSPMEQRIFHEGDSVTYRFNQRGIELFNYLLNALDEYDASACLVTRHPCGITFQVEQATQAMEVLFPPDVFDHFESQPNDGGNHAIDQGLRYACSSLVGAAKPLRSAIGAQLRFNSLGQVTLHCLLPHKELIQNNQTMYVQVIISPLADER
eukprot:GEMP01083041.1.p1 GENE.GEMP01083041.1~~GEMP01083041.1.p1  ORF type:complete len:272 (+),score=57.44 GEMP01083041.1:158-973(+)